MDTMIFVYLIVLVVALSTYCLLTIWKNIILRTVLILAIYPMFMYAYFTFISVSGWPTALVQVPENVHVISQVIIMPTQGIDGQIIIWARDIPDENVPYQTSYLIPRAYMLPYSNKLRAKLEKAENEKGYVLKRKQHGKDGGKRIEESDSDFDVETESFEIFMQNRNRVK